MKVGITSFCLDRTIHPVRLAQEAEARGFESLWYPEHSHIPASRLTPWPGGPERRAAARRLLAHARHVQRPVDGGRRDDRAARSARASCLIGERDPIWTAKQVASLDHLSGGRVAVRHRLRLEPRGAGEPRLPVGGSARDGAREGAGHARAVDRGRGQLRRRVRPFEPAWALPKPVQQPLPGITSAAAGGRSCSTRSASTATGGCRSRPDRRWPAASPCSTRRASATVATRRRSRSACSAPRPIRAGLESLAAEGVTRVVLTLPYEADDVVLPVLDEWAPLTGAFDG